MTQLRIDFADYECFTIRGIPIITGLPNFQPFEPWGLKMGAKVCKIGAPGKNGGVTSCARIDTWEPWVEYVGALYVSGFGNEGISKCMAFKLPPDGIKGPVGPYPYFTLYSVMAEGLLQPNFNRNAVRIFKPVFKYAPYGIVTEFNQAI